MPSPTLRRLIDKVSNAYEWDISATDDIAVEAERGRVLACAMDDLRKYVAGSDLSEQDDEQSCEHCGGCGERFLRNRERGYPCVHCKGSGVRKLSEPREEEA